MRGKRSFPQSLETFKSLCSWVQDLVWGGRMSFLVGHFPAPSMGGQRRQGTGMMSWNDNPSPALGLLNFTMNDRHTGPAWNILMWTLLFLGQGIQVSLYCQEWYARRHCPLPQVRQRLLPVPRPRRHPQPALWGSDSIVMVRDGMCGGGGLTF